MAFFTFLIAFLVCAFFAFCCLIGYLFIFGGSAAVFILIRKLFQNS